MVARLKLKTYIILLTILEVFKIDTCICRLLSKLQTGTSLNLILKGSSDVFPIIFIKVDDHCINGLREGLPTVIECDCICSFTRATPSCIEATTTFSNTTPIIISDAGPASPYPSDVVVSGLTGSIIKITVQLNNLTHTFPDDIDILLVSPLNVQNAIIMGDVGGGGNVDNVTLLLDDDAPTPLPDGSPLVSGTFQPANYGGVESFPPPAPVPIGGSALSVFNGLNPNGVWSLYIVDDLGGDVGSLAGGWSITITSCEL
jgi:subtilisin-like proprotein convertase family protein